MKVTEDILSQDLNPAQRMAVEYNDGPMLVIAGAGSGKTRMLTYKIAYLVDRGVAPWNILALTFTNKAAGEMKSRIGTLVGENRAQRIYMGTFHSTFARILRIEADKIGFTSQFTIYDESDSESLIRSIVKEMGLDDKTYKPSTVHKRISLAKNNMVSAEGYTADAETFKRDQLAHMPSVGKIYTVYQQRCRTANAIDFDDLLLHTYHLFATHEDVRQKWEEKFSHILVDEFQDTNKVQQMVLQQLTVRNRHICVVGDDAQSIYAFRGANLENILSFETVYPEAKVFKLERNYRSTQTIVKAANSLISHNRRQKEKHLFSENELGEKLQLKQAYSDREEAAIVVNEVSRLKHLDQCDYADFAILYRTNAQSRIFEDAFLKQGIPYRVCGGLSFYQRREIKDILAYYRLTANPNDEEAFKRIINYPTRGIGLTSQTKLTEAAGREGVSLWQLCQDIEKYSTDLNAGTKRKILAFVRLISSFRARLQTDDAYTLGHSIIHESGIYADIHSSADEEAIARQENVDEFDNALSTFVEEREEEGRADEVSLYHFLQEVSLSTDLESEGDDATSRVSLMTVHAAKGLEFSTVMVVGLDENIFPSPRTVSSERELEEERRLLYVAITRAARHCILTCAKNRWRYGKLEFFTPSRFIAEIDSRYIKKDETEQEEHTHQKTKTPLFARQVVQTPKNLTPMRKATAPTHPSNTSDTPYPTLRVGCTVEHQRFGRGRVERIDGYGADRKATVEFQNVGRKVLLLKFAKIDILS